MPKKSKQAQIKELEQILKKDIKKQEYVRIQSVLLNLKGCKHKEIAKIMSKSTDAIEKWITLFNKQGIKGLKSKPKEKKHQITNYKEGLIILGTLMELKQNHTLMDCILIQQCLFRKLHVDYF